MVYIGENAYNSGEIGEVELLNYFPLQALCFSFFNANILK